MAERSDDIMQTDRPVALAFGGLAAIDRRDWYRPLCLYTDPSGDDGRARLEQIRRGAGRFGQPVGLFRGRIAGGLAVRDSAPEVLASDRIGDQRRHRPRPWRLPSDIVSFVGLRFIGGVASAFVIVCSATLVLERLSLLGRGSLSAIQFAGVGFGIMISAIAVSAMLTWGAGWRSLWIGTGSLAMLAAVASALLIPPADDIAVSAKPDAAGALPSGIGAMVLAYGLFGFGYVITATFLVAIVRLTDEVRVLEPWVWTLFGLAAIPSVTIWSWLGERIGIMTAFAAACAVEAVGVATSVEWVTIPGVCLSALLLGGTFMGITVLGFMAGRMLSAGHPHQTFARMTASFSVGQMVGPLLAGFLSERFGDFRVASLIAAGALVIAAALAIRTSWVVAAHAAQQKSASVAQIQPIRCSP